MEIEVGCKLTERECEDFYKMLKSFKTGTLDMADVINTISNYVDLAFKKGLNYGNEK